MPETVDDPLVEKNAIGRDQIVDEIGIECCRGLTRR